VEIDNETDPECTVLVVEGKDQPHLLMTLSGQGRCLCESRQGAAVRSARFGSCP